MTDPEIITFGCRLNIFESEIMKGHAKDAGLKNTVIFNTCAVTSEATRQARQSIRRIRRERPDCNILVTGCAAQIDPKTFGDMLEVDKVIGNVEKLSAKSYRVIDFKTEEKIQVNDIMSVRETANHLIDGFDGKSRAFIQIQNGCDHRCTFCIIPYGRGNSRSVPMGEVVHQIHHLVEKGLQEVVLTGVDLTSYGPDLPGNPNLGQLVQSILKNVPALKRLRLSSIDSIEIDENLLEIITGEPRLMPHMHLSLQAGDNLILKRMKRRHSREDAIKFTEAVLKKRPEMVFGADIITGFPTETEEMFKNSLNLVDDCNLTFLHVFPYSEREGTPAIKMPSVQKSIRKERAKRLRDKGDIAISHLYKSLIGKKGNALIEKIDDNGNGFGHLENFVPITIDGALNAGQITRVEVSGFENGVMKGFVSSV
jgi:threonylcarbamoyladenosine tRNA methylthiotransferase MtaB